MTQNGTRSEPIQHKKIIVSKRLVAVNSASSVAARILNVTVLLWMYQYLLARISAEEFAVYPVVTAIIVVAPVFFTFFSGGISRYVIDAYAKGDLEEVGRIVSSILPMLGLAAIVFLVAGLVFAFEIEQVLNIAPSMVDKARLMMALLVVGLAIQLIFEPLATTGYQVRQRYVELNTILVLRDLLRIGLLLTLLLGISPSVVWVVLATVASDAVYLVIIVFRSRSFVPELRFAWHQFELTKARSLMSFGLWTTIGRLGSLMYTNAATIVLNLFGTAVDVTSFYIGATFFRQLRTTMSTAVLPLQPALTAMNALDDRRRLASTVLRAGRYALWVSLIVVTPLAIYADSFVALYLGPQYSQAATVLVLFMIMFPFSEATVLLPMTAVAMAQVRAFYLPAFLFQFLGLGLMLALVPGLGTGAIGAALSLTIITVAAQVAYFWSLNLRLAGINFTTFLRDVLIRGLAPAAAGVLIWGSLKVAWPPDNWLGLGTQGILGAVVYITTLLVFCLSVEDRADVRSQFASWK